MNAYRVKAHGLHSELDATLDRLSKSRASHKKIIAERDQTIAGLQVAINEMHIRAVDAEAGFPCVNERDTTITSLRDSLVAANAHTLHHEVVFTMPATVDVWVSAYCVSHNQVILDS